MKRGGKLSVLLRMLKLVSPLAGWMCLAIIAGTLGFLCAQFIPILGGYALLTSIDAGHAPSLRVLFTLLVVIALLRAVLKYTEQRTNHYIAFTLLAIIRDRVFRALRRLSPAKLEGRDKGDLISLITSDIELLEVFYAHTISPIAIAVLTEALMVIFISCYHPLLGVTALCAYLLVGAVLPVIISKRSGTLGDELRAESGSLAAYMLENIRGIEETAQYGCGETRLSEMNRRTDALVERQGVLNRLSGVNLALANTFILLSDIVMIAAAGMLYRNGSVGFDGFLIPVIALMSSFGPVSALAALGTTLQATIASGSRVLAVIDELPVTEDITGKEPVTFEGAALKDVHFAYDNEPVLNGFSAEFKKDRIIGVVGKSGCGKSTMLKLLMRFWNRNSGEINISGRDINEINTTDLRNMESYMTQSAELFKDTIANNIRIAKLDASEEEIIEAARKANIHDFIMTLPDGYETQVGELGETLSGGERQRIGLARAFLHNAPFLLLDEPTSNLDSLNEAIILKSLKEETDHRTVVLVSHRPSTVRIADDVIHVEHGIAAE